MGRVRAIHALLILAVATQPLAAAPCSQLFDSFAHGECHAPNSSPHRPSPTDHVHRAAQRFVLSGVAGEEDWLRDADDNAVLAPTHEPLPAARATGGFCSRQPASVASPHSRHMVRFCTWQI